HVLVALVQAAAGGAAPRTSLASEYVTRLRSRTRRTLRMGQVDTRQPTSDNRGPVNDNRNHSARSASFASTSLPPTGLSIAGQPALGLHKRDPPGRRCVRRGSLAAGPVVGALRRRSRRALSEERSAATRL